MAAIITGNEMSGEKLVRFLASELITCTISTNPNVDIAVPRDILMIAPALRGMLTNNPKKIVVPGRADPVLFGLFIQFLMTGTFKLPSPVVPRPVNSGVDIDREGRRLQLAIVIRLVEYSRLQGVEEKLHQAASVHVEPLLKSNIDILDNAAITAIFGSQSFPTSSLRGLVVNAASRSYIEHAVAQSANIFPVPPFTYQEALDNSVAFSVALRMAAGNIMAAAQPIKGNAPRPGGGHGNKMRYVDPWTGHCFSV